MAPTRASGAADSIPPPGPTRLRWSSATPSSFAPASAAAYPGVPPGGFSSGRLENSGEHLPLPHALGTTIFSSLFDTNPPWPITPDGYGFSLVRATTALDPDSPAAWRPSANLGGSP